MRVVGVEGEEVEGEGVELSPSEQRSTDAV